MLRAICLKSKKSHKSFNIYGNLIRIILFKRTYNYLPSLKIPKMKKIIDVLGAYSKISKACLEPYGPLPVK